MIKAIVYTSNTGFTKKYAEILSKETGINVYEFKEAKGRLNKNDEIIYMGWIMAGTIKGFEEARKRYNVKVVCAVGMGMANEKQNKELIEKQKIEKQQFFYLQGGFDMNKLHGVYKFMMNCMKKFLVPTLEKKDDKTDSEIEYLNMIKNGKDCVKKENLDPVINWIENN